jgi:hypothetical protein
MLDVDLKRCKNLRLDRSGVVETRDGSSKLNSTAIQTGIYKIIELGGVRYVFANTIIYRNESSIGTGMTAAQWSAIIYNSYNATVENVFALNGTNRKRIEGSSVYEWGIAAPSTVPTITTGAEAGLTGDYNAKYSYCRKSGSTVICESNLSGAGAAAVTLADGSLSVTWTASADTQVTHVRVYRTLTDGGVYYHDQDVATGTLTVDSNTSDGALGTLAHTDHDRPPLGSFVFGPNYNGTCFIIKDNLLYFCKPKQPEYWPSTYYIEVSPITYVGQCVVLFNGQTYFLTKHKIYYIQGSGSNTFFPVEMDSITGAQGPQAACSVQGHGIYHVGTDGIYLYSTYDKNITQSHFGPIFRGETVNGLPGAKSLENSWIIQFRNRVYFGYPTTAGGYPTACLVFNLDNNRVSYFAWSTPIRTVCVDKYNNWLLGADTSGYIWHLENEAATKDNTTAISWELESKDFTLQTRAHFPRWVKYDVDASDSDCSATGTLLLDDVSQQTHTITGDRTTRRRLVETGNGEGCSMRVSGSGPVKIYKVESE